MLASRAFAWVSDHSARLLAVSFALYGAIFAAFFALNMPPFQNADEVSHVFRAAQISRGQMIGLRRADGSSGGMVDDNLSASFWPFAPVLFHPDTKVTRFMYAASGSGWAGQEEWQNFPNTAMYSPVFYLPAAAGLWMGRRLHLSILQSLHLARLGNALVAILLGSAGVWVAGRAAPFLFAVLSLPMALALMANVSQDGVMIGCTALVAGLVAAYWQYYPRGSVPLLAAASLMLALLCMARPPYAPLSMVPLFLPGLALRPRLAAAIAILAACTAWSGFAAVQAAGVLRPDDPAINPSGQIHWIAGHLIQTADIVMFSIRTEAATLLEQFIGRLGWLDTALPASYRVAASSLLPIAALLALDGDRGQQPYPGLTRLYAALVITLAIAACVALLFIVQYITWNEVGSAIIGGVQGRYLLPLALIAAAMLPALPAAPRWWVPARGALVVGLAAFPAFSIGVVIHAVVLRYYLT